MNQEFWIISTNMMTYSPTDHLIIKDHSNREDLLFINSKFMTVHLQVSTQIIKSYKLPTMLKLLSKLDSSTWYSSLPDTNDHVLQKRRQLLQWTSDAGKSQSHSIHSRGDNQASSPHWSRSRLDTSSEEVGPVEARRWRKVLAFTGRY